MKKIKALKIVSTVLLILSVFAFLISTIGGAFMFQNADAVSAALGIPEREILPGKTSSADNEYFKSNFQSVAEVKKSNDKRANQRNKRI